MPDIFDQIHSDQSSGGGDVFDQIHKDAQVKTSGSLSIPGAEQAYNTPYSDIVSNPNTNPLQKSYQVGLKVLGQAGQGVQDVVSSMPSAIAAGVKGAMPTSNLPVPGGQTAEDMANSVLKAYQLAKDGQFSEAAKHIPFVGGIYDYATNHPIAQTAGAGVAMAGLGEAAEGMAGKLADTAAVKAGTKAKPPVFAEAPTVKPFLELFKPENAVKASTDYPVAISRLVREHPEIQSGNVTLKQVSDALDESMMENRHYNEAFTGPAKAARMQVDLSPISKAIEDSITPLMEKNSPGTVKELRSLAAKYRTKADISDLESMLRETNAKVTDLNKLNPGERYNATTASESKAVLDATNKAFRETYNNALEKFTGSPAVKQLNKEYGAMMGFRQDLADYVQKELVAPPVVKPGAGAKFVEAGKNALNLKFGDTVSSLKDAILHKDPLSGTEQLAQALKNYKGPVAPDYPVPPPPPNKLLAAPPAQVGAGPARPIPQGPIPPGMGPSAAYPTGQKALPKPTPGQKTPLVTPPPADTSGPVPSFGPRPGAGMGQQVGERQLPAPAAPIRPHPGDTYGERGMGPAVTSERPPEWSGRSPVVATTHDMVKIAGNGWVTRAEAERILAEQRKKGPGAPLPKKP